MKKHMTARSRLILCGAIGVLAAFNTSKFVAGRFVPLIAWDAAALAYMTSVLFTVIPLDGPATKSHASRENPGRIASDIILVIGSLASLVAVALLLVQASGDKTFGTILGLCSVIVSWMLIHTSFLLRYARVYFDKTDGGVDFNQSGPPTYGDFAYLAFTIGMAYQVSDTNITSTPMRRTILHHALLSYIFGTIVIATTINALASLAQ